MDVERFEIGAFLSQATSFGGIVWLSGMVTSQDPARQSVSEQTVDTLAQIERRLIAAGTGKDRLLFANIWLTDIADWSDANDAWMAWLGGAIPPARATVQSKLVPPYGVEIAVVAARYELP